MAKGKGGRFGIAPPTAAETDNLADGAKVLKDLNFKVPPEFHTEFKSAAFLNGLKMNELLVQALKAWKDNQAKS